MWTCPQCGRLNSAVFRYQCVNCATPRPLTTPIVSAGPINRTSSTDRPQFGFLKFISIIHAIGGVVVMLAAFVSYEHTGLWGFLWGVLAVVAGSGMAVAFWALWWLTDAVGRIESQINSPAPQGRTD